MSSHNLISQSRRHKRAISMVAISGIGVAGALSLFNSQATVPFIDSSSALESEVTAAQSQAAPLSAGEDGADWDGTATGHASRTTSPSSASDRKSEVSVTINGQSVPVPKSGHLHTVVGESDNRTVIDVNTSQDGSSSAHSSSTVHSVTTSSSGTSGVSVVTHSSN